MKRFLILITSAFLVFCFKNAVMAAEPEPVNEYAAIFASASEADYRALEKVVYNESAGCLCKHEVNVAVVETVLNRVLQGGDYGSTIYDVCTKKWQFVCKDYKKGTEADELIADAIAEVVNSGRTILPSCEYTLFATKKQTIGKDHIWLGERTHAGKPKKGKGMYFARMK